MRQINRYNIDRNLLSSKKAKQKRTKKKKLVSPPRLQNTDTHTHIQTHTHRHTHTLFFDRRKTQYEAEKTI